MCTGGGGRTRSSTAFFVLFFAPLFDHIFKQIALDQSSMEGAIFTLAGGIERGGGLELGGRQVPGEVREQRLVAGARFCCIPRPVVGHFAGAILSPEAREKNGQSSRARHGLGEDRACEHAPWQMKLLYATSCPLYLWHRLR